MTTERKKILVVDDDTTFLLMLQSFLEKRGFAAEVESDAERGLAAISKKDFDLVLSDYRMPGMNGIELLEKLNARGIATPLILITSYGDIKLAVKAMKLGAADYLTKPVNPEELYALVKSVLTQKALEQSPRTAFTSIPKTPGHDFVEGRSAETRKVNEYVELVAPTNMTVLIQGETGTGKEYVARQIHRYSDRREESFVAVDCGSLSKELAASELFGHVKGSFTGAVQDHIGQFEAARRGTVFLDEIGNLGYDIQVKLLRALQEKTIRRLGGNKDIPIDVRLIAATNDNMSDAIYEDRFREDLFHRINEFKIELSPLRIRQKEIMQFARHFLAQSNAELNKNIEDFDDETQELLQNYPWPGNLRELKNVVRRSVLLSSGTRVEKKALPGEIASHTEELDRSRINSDTTDLKQLEGRMERQKIMEALEKVHYNKTKAAKLLNIDRKTLYNKIKAYGLKV